MWSCIHGAWRHLMTGRGASKSWIRKLQVVPQKDITELLSLQSRPCRSLGYYKVFPSA